MKREQTFVSLVNSEVRKDLKVQLCSDDCVDNCDTREMTILPDCKTELMVDGTKTRKLIFAKSHRGKTVNVNKKRNCGKYMPSYDSCGSKWHVTRKDVTKSCPDEFSLEVKKLHKKKKNEFNQAVEGQADNTCLFLSRNSLFYDHAQQLKKSSNVFQENDVNENNVSKIWKKHKSKNTFFQPQAWNVTEGNTLLVSRRKELNQNEFQNIDNPMEWEKNKTCKEMLNLMLPEREKEGVELEKKQKIKSIKKFKRKETVLIENVSVDLKKNDMENAEERNDMEQSVNSLAEEYNVRQVRGESDNADHKMRNKKRKQKFNKHSIITETENRLYMDETPLKNTGEIEKESEELCEEEEEEEEEDDCELEKKKQQRRKKVRVKKRKELIVEGGNEWEKSCEEVTKEESLVKRKKKKLKLQVENEDGQLKDVEKMVIECERKNCSDQVENEKGKKNQVELIKQEKQRKPTKNILDGPFGGDDASDNHKEQTDDDETIGRIKKKVTKLSIESEDENETEINGKERNEKFENRDVSKYTYFEDDSEEDEEVNDFIVDDNYISYDEDATSDEEYEDTDYDDDNDNDNDNDNDVEDTSEEEEEMEKEKYREVCSPVRKERKRRMAMQFIEMEAEEGEETEVEEEEEETSDEDDGGGDEEEEEEDEVGVEQFIDSEAREEVFFVRRKKKVQVIESEEEKEEKCTETDSLEKTVHIMQKLTRLMTAGFLKCNTRRKEEYMGKNVCKEVNEFKECSTEVRIRMNQSKDFAEKAINEKKRTKSDGESENRKVDELRIQQRVGEEIREILGEDKLGKKKRKRNATDWGRGYASDSEYVEAVSPRTKRNKFI